MYWLLESEPVSVSAFSLPRGRQEPVGENNVAASFVFEDDSIANLNYTTAGHSSMGGERVEAFAPGITALTENFKRLEVASDSMIKRSSWFPQKGYLAQMESFVNAIRSGKSPEVTVKDGVRASLGCLRMLESARHSRACEIGLQLVLD
jgi:hypothetical protein